jgi:hypothetical protein
MAETTKEGKTRMISFQTCTPPRGGEPAPMAARAQG